MASKKESNAELIFENIRNEADQYTTEEIQIWNCIKPELLEILKEYHPVKRSDYQFDKKQSGKKHLVVFEFDDDKTKVRQYSETYGRQWYCCECRRLKSEKTLLFIKYGIVFVKNDHSCETREYSSDMSDQCCLRGGKAGPSAAENLESNAEESGSSSGTTFTTIKESPEEYTTEEIQDWDSIKPELEEILKLYRPMKLSDYQYGLNEQRRENSRLIIFEVDNDKTKVREYFEVTVTTEKEWHCAECKRLEIMSKRTGNIALKVKSKNTRLLIKFGILFVKRWHRCIPRELSVVMSIQEFFKNRRTGKKSYHNEQKKILKKSKNSSNESNQFNESNDAAEETFENNVSGILEFLKNDRTTVAAEKEPNVELLINEIKDAVEEYTTEANQNWTSIKPEILEILKEYHPIKRSEYHFDTKIGGRKFLTVFEFDDDKTKVRQYSETSGRQWLCCECRRLKLGKTYLLIKYGIVFVRNIHQCEPKDYSCDMDGQNSLDEATGSNEEGKLRNDKPTTLNQRFLGAQNSRNVLESTFTTIKESPEEYTKEEIQDWDSIKPEIDELLKLHRPIKLLDYQYGLNEQRRENSRLNVFEVDNDRTKVREYCDIMVAEEKQWHCCECKRREVLNTKRANPWIVKSKNTRLLFKFGILFVKKTHACFPREVSIVMSIQEFFKNKRTGKKSYYHEQKKLLKKSQNSSNESSRFNETDDAAEETFVNNATGEETFENNVSGILESMFGTGTEEESAITASSNPGFSIKKEENAEDSDCIVLDTDDDAKPPISKKPRLEENEQQNQPHRLIIQYPL